VRSEKRRLGPCPLPKDLLGQAKACRDSGFGFGMRGKGKVVEQLLRRVHQIDIIFFQQNDDMEFSVFGSQKSGRDVHDSIFHGYRYSISACSPETHISCH
jgi:hypothetical protein